MGLITKLIIFHSLLLPTFAADCSSPNKEFYDDAAKQMMWSVRGWVCSNAWWESVTAGPQGGWCNNGGPTHSGSWTIKGMTSEQECWVRPFHVLFDPRLAIVR